VHDFEGALLWLFDDEFVVGVLDDEGVSRVDLAVSGNGYAVNRIFEL